VHLDRVRKTLDAGLSDLYCSGTLRETTVAKVPD
jgi:hypothetical protein